MRSGSLYIVFIAHLRGVTHYSETPAALLQSSEIEYWNWEQRGKELNELCKFLD